MDSRCVPINGSTTLVPVTSVRNVRPWGGELSNITIANGLIESIESAGQNAPASGYHVDGRGGMALPGFINAHAHLDKSWWGLPWESNPGRPTVAGRIAWERERREALGIPSVEFTKNVLAQMIRSGTTGIRTHVDIDPEIGIRGIEVVREAVATYSDAIHVEIVAFPQDGVVRRPGTLELLAEAIKLGVEHIGGIDPASIDRDPVGQLDAIFGLAGEFGVGVDIHLHDPGELGAFQLELIIAYTESTGLAGNVTVSHGFAFTQVDAERRRDLLQAMAALDISVATVAPPRFAQLPLHDFDDAKVRLGLGTDGIRDLWNPYGTGDILGIAWQLARGSNLLVDADLTRVVQLATRDGGHFVGMNQHDLAVGSRADIVVMDSHNPMDALVRLAPRTLVIGGGRLLFGGA